jgi:hypothetical protein
VIHAYGIVTRSDGEDLSRSVASFRGIDGAPAQVLLRDRIAAVFTQHAQRPSAALEAVMSHARLVEDIWRWCSAVLPVRFDGTMTDVGFLTSALDERSEAAEQRLARVRQCVEFGIRVTPVDPEDGPADVPGDANGRGYLMRKATLLRHEDEQRQRAERAVRSALESLPARPLEWMSLPVSRSEATVARASLLVRDDDAESVLSQLAAVSHHERGVEVTVVGPLPPYSFTEVAL